MGKIQALIDGWLNPHRYNPSFGNESAFYETVARASALDPTSGAYAVALPPDPSFSTLRDLQDRQLKQRAGDDNQSIRFLYLSVTSTGVIFDAAVDANAFALIPRLYDQGGNVIESSDAARISIEVNRNGAYIPFSFNILPQGVQKGDLVSFSGKISYLRIRVEQITQDAVNQPVIIVGLAKDVSLLAPYGGISLYTRPNAAAGDGTVSGGAMSGAGSTASSSGAGTGSGVGVPGVPVYGGGPGGTGGQGRK